MKTKLLRKIRKNVSVTETPADYVTRLHTVTGFYKVENHSTFAAAKFACHQCMQGYIYHYAKKFRPKPTAIVVYP